MINTAKREALIEMIRDFAAASSYFLRYDEYDGKITFEFVSPLDQYKKHTATFKWDDVDNIFLTFKSTITGIVSAFENPIERSRSSVYDNKKWSEFVEYCKADVENARKLYMAPIFPTGKLPSITKIKFNPPATIIFWADDTKTVVKAHDEGFDPEKGVAMAIAKKALGNKGNYYNEIRKCLDEYDDEVYDCETKVMAPRLCNECRYACYEPRAFPCSRCFNVKSHPYFKHWKKD